MKEDVRNRQEMSIFCVVLCISPLKICFGGEYCYGGKSMKTVSRKRNATLNMVRIAMLTAVSLVLMQFDIPIIGFYKLDFSNVPVLLGAFGMGPGSGIAILALKNLIDGLLLSQSLGIGQVADFVIVAGLVLPAALICQKNRTMKGAIVGMVVGSVVMAIDGALMNLFVLIPAYCGEIPFIPGFISREAVVGMFTSVLPKVDSVNEVILYATLPFNLMKAVAVSLLTMLLYKRVSPILKSKK